MAIEDKSIDTGKGYNVGYFTVSNVALNVKTQEVTVYFDGAVNSAVESSYSNYVLVSAQTSPELYTAVIEYAEALVSAKIDEINTPTPEPEEEPIDEPIEEEGE